MNAGKKITDGPNQETHAEINAQEALKAYLNEIVLKPLEEQQTAWLPKLKDEISNGNTDVQERIEEILDGASNILESLATEIESVKSTQSTSDEKLRLLDEQTKQVVTTSTDTLSRLEAFGARLKSIETSLEKVVKVPEQLGKIQESIQTLKSNVEVLKSSLASLTPQIEKESSKLFETIAGVEQRILEDQATKNTEILDTIQAVVNSGRMMHIASLSIASLILIIVIVMLVRTFLIT